MIQIERSKPIHHIIEEREPFHLTETAKIDIRTLLLHIHHLAYLLFHLLHALLISILVEDTLYRIFFLFHNAKTPDCQIRVAHDIRHNITLNLVIILLSILTIEELNL